MEALLHPLVSPKVIGHCLGLHHQTIYEWIYRSRPDLRERLPYQGKKRRRYGKKREKYSGWTRKECPIAERVDDTLSWEGDTIKGSTRHRILTHVDRSSLYLRADLIPDGTADSVHTTLKRDPLHGTITYDRGSEFALWQMLERNSNTNVFFAKPHHPWQRGKNENTNRRLRKAFPKRCDLSTISKGDLAVVVDLMNHTLRESLNWQYPTEVYQERCV